MSRQNLHQGLCCNVTLLNDYVGLHYSLIVMAHYKIHLGGIMSILYVQNGYVTF